MQLGEISVLCFRVGSEGAMKCGLWWATELERNMIPNFFSPSARQPIDSQRMDLLNC